MRRKPRGKKTKHFTFKGELSLKDAQKIAGGIKGFDHEKRALEIAKGLLKKFFKRVKYIVDPCARDDLGRKQKARDLKFIIERPRILKGKEIYLEIKSSKTGTKEHIRRGKAQLIYRTGAVIVNSKRSDEKIARAMYNFIKNELRNFLKKEIEKTWYSRLPEKLLKRLIIRLSS